jgi:hypothetical protein
MAWFDERKDSHGNEMGICEKTARQYIILQQSVGRMADTDGEHESSGRPKEQPGKACNS